MSETERLYYELQLMTVKFLASQNLDRPAQQTFNRLNKWLASKNLHCINPAGFDFKLVQLATQPVLQQNSVGV